MDLEEKFRERIQSQTIDYLKTVKMWLNKHIQDGVDPEVAINKISNFNRDFQVKLKGIQNSFIRDFENNEHDDNFNLD